ncbi:cell wall hydrolase [Paracoccus zhejiangensis]|uniref:Cell wall hydrolase n=1 Tax=Paracoccus zhejiangensis TaxID=1077935 RepID=A0A2H5EWS7_9RHOB|nr:cell wall hydrolase [Paracoccus zhejiangensis]AUH63766.1 cell wall hydrolase [Paracoccus zhejiangensis]
MDMPRPKPLLYVDAEPVQVAGGPEQVYKTRATTAFSGRDLDCMAEALYFEARGEGRQGQAAVAEVILNRVASGKFPNSVCGVINQPSQFSYTIGGRKTIRSKAAYLRVRQVAENALAGGTGNLTGGATYFHTPAVRPAWSRRFERTVRIGRHIFYRTGQRIASN